jgi:glycosyltransferase involved in cell wall biosynthesis
VKVLILTSSFPFHKGDHHSNFIFYQALGQVKRGNEVHVVCPHHPGMEFLEDMEGITVHRFPYFYPYNLQRLSPESGMYSGLHHSILGWFQLPFYFISEWYHADRIIRRYNIDIIHSHWIVPQGLVGFICRKIRHKAHVVSSHVTDAQIFCRWGMLKPGMRMILSGTDLLTTNSSFTKGVLENLLPLPCPCVVIPMGVVPPEGMGDRIPATDAPRILFVGRLIRWKGVDTLIRAMAQVIREKPGAILSIVGDGEERANLEHLVHDLGISDHVRFLGRVNNEQLSSLYANASVFVLPSRSYQGLVMEGLGVVLLEAMAHGVPVIGSDIGGIPDIIKDGSNGFLFPSEDEKKLATKIVTVLSDKVIADRFQQAGCETVRTRFSWEEISRQFSGVYEQALDQQSRKGAI